jgi:hypothetical protein
MSKSCFTCENHNFEKSWLDNKICVECMGLYAEKVATRSKYKYSHKVASRALGIDRMVREMEETK